ncbi:MAG: 3-dehydroquinate synthase [Armatimonadetes bacterium]|nr:3-dehydroquinate synthase [Armatimonadota bacterium]
MEYFLNSKKTEIIFQNDFRIAFPKETKKVFLIDRKVYQLFKNKLCEIIDEASFFISASEENKSIKTIEHIYRFFRENNVNRSCIIIGIGGGITTDITAFAASTYKRGCRLILVPTTFLGMIDAAIGGKTAVNFEGIKNSIGTFYPAEKVFIIPKFLTKLPEKEIKNGLIECIKIALIRPSNLYDILISKKGKITFEILKMAIDLKLSICDKDLEDKNERKHLNLGHTFAHILESISNYEISHGTAVSIGLRAAAELSMQSRYIDDATYEKIIFILDFFQLPNKIPGKYKNRIKEKGLEILLQDKKATSRINVVLFNEFLSVFIKEIEKPGKILQILDSF